MTGKIVPLDVAGNLWEFASCHSSDFLWGNHTRSLTEWARFLNYLHFICSWNLVIYMDGMEDINKVPESERRRIAVEAAREKNNVRG